MSTFKSWLYENDIICFVLKGAENLPARGRKTEKNITLASRQIPMVCIKQLWCDKPKCNGPHLVVGKYFQLANFLYLPHNETILFLSKGHSSCTLALFNLPLTKPFFFRANQHFHVFCGISGRHYELHHNNMMSQTLITFTIWLWRARPWHFGVAFLYARVYRRGTFALWRKTPLHFGVLQIYICTCTLCIKLTKRKLF
jgi:hypothetical protein